MGHPTKMGTLRSSAHAGEAPATTRGALDHTSVCGVGWKVCNCVELAVSEIQALHFLQVERARASASEDRHLISALIYAAIAIDAFGDGQRGSSCVMSRNQFGSGTRTESREVGIVGGRKQLKHAQSVLSIGYVGEQFCRDHPEFDVVYVVHGAIGIENLIQLGLLGMLNIHRSEEHTSELQSL